MVLMMPAVALNCPVLAIDLVGDAAYVLAQYATGRVVLVAAAQQAELHGIVLAVLLEQPDRFVVAVGVDLTIGLQRVPA